VSKIPLFVRIIPGRFSFRFVAALGLLLSFFLHVASLAGVAPTSTYLIWGLSVGIFVVSFATIAVVSRMLRGAHQKDWWKIALSGCPRWMRLAPFALLVYAAAGFFIAMRTIDHGQATGGYSSSYIQAFSVHLAAFYAVTFALLYSAAKNGPFRVGMD
jgi:hypothetical protein